MGALGLDKGFDTQDGLYDLAWSECHENQMVTASGDGSVKLWDIMLNPSAELTNDSYLNVQDYPIRKWHEHQREVFSIDWSNVQKELFCTSSWDGSIKIWTPDRSHSLTTIPAHTSCVYAALFSPSNPSLIASCSSDGSLKIWDTRSPLPSSPSSPSGPALASPQLAIPAHPGAEVLDLDWNKYEANLIATGSVDRTIRVHDLRRASPAPPAPASPHLEPNATVATLLGHEYAVRRVQWSPHSASLLVSGSYDMTARIWSLAPALTLASAPGVGSPATARFDSGGMNARMERIWDRHTEFVVGVGWSLYEQGEVGSCGWDGEVHLWR
ncbi:SPOSA6832_04975 [Sporobolomyces salmonicolor]|uniref:Peroxin-7 n=1 Tax=Sporidiobolus salmonicolor TaxID=5005 RepID=A0A0D6EU09_SPOSA|nr:SPOSA6832_04975 [Sporobolomyces salmonicolor]